MKKTKLFISLLIITLFSTQLFSHCQVPCGIYDDAARVKAMLEDCETVSKAATKIAELSGKTDAQSKNQLVRWVNNKEIHAEKIISTIGNYFMTQRIKPSQKDYKERLVKHHTVILLAMKAKQKVDTENIKALHEAIEALAPYYKK